MAGSECIFCRIVAGEIKAAVIYEDPDVVVFLDNGPIFHGHSLVCPKVHRDTLMDVPAEQLGPLMEVVQLTARAVEAGLGAEGSFIAVNNKISQSVPHLHVHVIPRRRKDGLKGFFWPRKTYKDAEEMEQVRAQLQAAIDNLRGRSAPHGSMPA